MSRTEEFNKQSSNKGGGYFVERVVLTSTSGSSRWPVGIRAIAVSFWGKRKAHPSNRNQDLGRTLEAMSDKEVVVILSNWNFPSEKGATIKMLGKHINPLPGMTLGGLSQVPTGCR